MAIEVRWLDEDEMAIFWRFDPYWTPQDYRQAVTDTKTMLRSRPELEVDIIADMRSTVMFPVRVVGAAVEYHRTAPADSNYGVGIVVSGNVVHHAIYQMLDALPDTQSRFVMTDTMEQAHDIWQERQHTRLAG